MKYLLTVFASFMLCFGIFGVSPVSANFDPGMCEAVYVDVALSPGAAVTDSLYVEVCSKRGVVRNRPVQILIHGGSYDSRYWNPSFGRNRYSYVEYMVNRNYTVINIDRIGVGRASRPSDPMTVDFNVAAHTIHQLVQNVRNGTLSTMAFGNIQSDRVVLTGFSFGSMIATIEAATYNDVDGILLQAYSHTVGPAGVASFDLAYPARFEPRFNGLNDFYFTTIPFVRPELFFHRPGTDPYILFIDEVWKQTYTLAELMGIGPAMGASYGVTAPVFLIVGDYDLIACEAPNCTTSGSLNTEAQHFPLAASFEVQIVPEAGHTLNWHNTAPTAFNSMEAWLRRTFR